VISVRNPGAEPREFSIETLSHPKQSARHYSLAPGASMEDRWAIAANGHWYDIALRSGSLLCRWAGHMETGKPSHSDPALG
jgi:phospholipase C